MDWTPSESRLCWGLLGTVAPYRHAARLGSDTVRFQLRKARLPGDPSGRVESGGRKQAMRTWNIPRRV